MDELLNSNTVVLLSNDRIVINLCRHALEPLLAVHVVNHIPPTSLGTLMFSGPIIIDTKFFDDFNKAVPLPPSKFSQTIFLASGGVPAGDSYSLHEMDNLIPFPCDLDMLRGAVCSRLPPSPPLLSEFAGRSAPDAGVDTTGFETLCGSSKVMVELRRQLASVAKNELTVLLLGESGTGKTLAATLLHKNSARHLKRFVAVDMTTIVEGLAESELFGTVPGAYTGATKRAGKFAKADGGTLFLDEIGEMSLSLQPKLLRVIETGNFCRVGSDDEQHVDIRLVCATNENLPLLVSHGKFRRDLYYRIADYTIVMPSLREHVEDICALAESFLKDNGKTLAESAKEKLAQYDWPGNVRQLKNCMRRAGVMTRGDSIDADAITF